MTAAVGTARVPARRARGGATTGAAPLLAATLRHDGRRFAPWVAVVTLLSASSVLVYPWVFPSAASRLALATAVGANPAIGLVFGPADDLTTPDGFNAWRALALGGFLAALGAIFAVVRATRAQEDSGQAELLASGVLGRGSRLLAGVALALIGSLVLGTVACLVTVLCGGGWGPSALIAATFVATGWMFAGVAAVTSQLGSDARTASSMAVGTLGTLYLLRGVALSLDAPAWTSWVNPMSWTVETHPATEAVWWPLLLTVALTAVLLAVASVLQSRRDFGQGAIAPGPGPARGRDTGPGRLAVRLNRGLVVTWSVAFVLLGTVFGFFATSVTDIVGADPAVRQVLAAGATSPDQLVSAFLVTILSLLGIIAAVPGIQVVLKVRSEELDDRVEPLLATALARPRYLAGNVLTALATSTLCVLVAGMVLAGVASAGDVGVAFGDALLQAVATVPAVWTVVAVSVAVVGAHPAVSLAAWLGVLASFGLTLLGPTFGLDDWVLGISPFWHVPNVTAASVDLTGLLWVTLVTAVLLAVGFAGFRRRDLAR